MINKSYDVFLAYNGTYEPGGSSDIAGELYDYLKLKGLRVFFFPKCSRDIYKANIIEVLKSKTFIFVCSDALHTSDNGRIDSSYHYELSTEIDAFYAMTQMDEDGSSVQDSKVLVCDPNGFKGRKGSECQLHDLFANRTHFYLRSETDDRFDEIYEWILGRVRGSKRPLWNRSKVTNEVKRVYAKRASMSQDYDLPSLIAGAHSIRCIGISNTELTAKMDPDAINFALSNGAEVELVFLDPDGVNTARREEEEHHVAGRIACITKTNMGYSLDLKRRLPEEMKGSYRIYQYDEVPRLNLIIIDSVIILQYYANSVPGLKNPCFIIERQEDESPLYDFCINVYESLRSNAVELGCDL